MTNYEKMMNMEVGELADFLSRFPDNVKVCKLDTDECDVQAASLTGCQKYFSEWLESDYESEIANCPLCGASCVWENSGSHNGYITCTNPQCMCRSYDTGEIGLTRVEMIKRWNKR